MKQSHFFRLVALVAAMMCTLGIPQGQAVSPDDLTARVAARRVHLNRIDRSRTLISGPEGGHLIYSIYDLYCIYSAVKRQC